MTVFNTNNLDQGLNYIQSNGGRMDLCSQEPTDYTEATSTYSLGNETSASVAVAEDGPTDGRMVVIAEVTAGTVSSDGVATHWALTNGGGLLLIAAALDSSIAVSTAGTWTLNEIQIRYRFPVVV